MIYDWQNAPTKESIIAFEHQTRADFEAGVLPYLVHLSGGNEDQLLELFKRDVRGDDWVLSTHRNHYHFLLKGGDPDELRKEIRAGRSMFIYDRKLRFITSSILGGLCGVAAGLAWEIKAKLIANKARGWDDFSAWDTRYRPEIGHREHVWCFLGDGAEDNGHLYEAALFVFGNNLPCTFVIEDNGFSVDTPTSERTGGSRMIWPPCVRRYTYHRTYPHAGPGLDRIVPFDPNAVALYRKKGFDFMP